MNKVRLDFDNTFNGTLTSETESVKIGVVEGSMRPYQLLFGALGSCLYSTFLDIIEKKRLTFDSVVMEISGEKRSEVPTTLKTGTILMVIKNPSNEEQFIKSAKLASKYCSIYETVSKVAELTLEVEFIKD